MRLARGSRLSTHVSLTAQMRPSLASFLVPEANWLGGYSGGLSFESSA